MASASDFGGEDTTTLDEPVSETIKRDCMRIGKKLIQVVIPFYNPGETEEDKRKSIKDWDLWGPLILCMLLAVTLATRAPSDQQPAIFTSVFVIIWLGAAVVTLNTQLLGGSLSFFQSVCVLGYCVFPLNLSSFLIVIFRRLAARFIIVGIGFLWSTVASLGFISSEVPEKRKALSIYPVILFYLSLSWIIILQ